MDLELRHLSRDRKGSNGAKPNNRSNSSQNEPVKQRSLTESHERSVDPSELDMDPDADFFGAIDLEKNHKVKE